MLGQLEVWGELELSLGRCLELGVDGVEGCGLLGHMAVWQVFLSHAVGSLGGSYRKLDPRLPRLALALGPLDSQVSI